MNRRSFFKFFATPVVTGVGVWLALKETTLARMVTSWFGGTKEIRNARPVPPFTVRSFANEPSIRTFVIGDWGTGNAFQRRVAQAMQSYATAEKPQFIISTGDNFYPSGVSSVSDKQFTTAWKNVYTGDALNVPWYIALGNHDYRQNPDAQTQYHSIDSMWNMPGRYYMFSRIEQGITADFFVIDTDMIYTGKKQEIRQQLDWLDDALKKSSAQWKVVVGHHMIRSHGVYGDQPVMMQTIKPLADRYGVHLYINGHDHDLQLLKAEEDTFTCIISGGGGGARDTGYGKNTLFASTNGGFVALAMTKEIIHAQFIDAGGTVLYGVDVATSHRR